MIGGNDSLQFSSVEFRLVRGWLLYLWRTCQGLEEIIEFHLLRYLTLRLYVEDCEAIGTERISEFR